MTADFDTERLDAWAAAHVDDYIGPARVEKFPGGQSNPTYRVDTSTRSYVLRRKPFGTLLPSAHAVDREFRVIAALGSVGFPVPPAYALAEDEGVIGVPFYVMGMVEGRGFWDGALPGISPEERRAIYHSMIDTLARLHGLDPQAIGLGDYGRPGNYFARQVERWTRQYRASETERIEAVERVIDFLARAVPDQARTAIVHGDYRIDNLIFAPDAPRALAVLDWELSTLGDPLADFSYLLLNWVLPADGRAGLAGLDLDALGIPTLEEAVERYCAQAGRDGLPDLNWYFAYNLFRLAAILQGVKKRALDGNASSAEALSMAKRIPLLADAAWHYAEQAGA